MAKRIKAKQISIRVDELLDSRIQSYVDISDITVGHLFRRAVKEYIDAHPNGDRQRGFMSVTDATMTGKNY